MLLRRDTLEAIRDGRVTLQFRRWARPRVRVGTRMRTAVGLVEVAAVERVDDPAALTAADARAAGVEDVAALLEAPRGREGAPLWRIGVRYAGADPRVALREDDALDAEALAALRARVDAIDARSKRGPWAWEVLELIDRRPAVRAADLAASLGRETLPFKADVRRLKELGLTESLETGYRISARGRALLAARAAR